MYPVFLVILVVILNAVAALYQGIGFGKTTLLFWAGTGLYLIFIQADLFAFTMFAYSLASELNM